ncbi:hypothetical protein C8Q78DRAFT_970143 [Trametes maxima]|nr:hypothetical protein C8Q78DRAFT_970143 [Trametes maxima]
MPIWKCSGCNKSFKREGHLVEHFRGKNLDERCIRAPVQMGELPEHPMQLDDHEDEPEAMPFEGDFYGADYGEDDFPFDEHDTADEESDDEDDEDGDEFLDAVGRDILESNSEPLGSEARPPIPLPASPHLPPDQEQDLPQGYESNDATAPGPGPSAPGDIEEDAHNRLRSAPVHIQHFGGNAGAPVTAFASNTSGYQAYGETVDHDANNPYSPFCSEIDWQLAHWAKTCGLSSNTYKKLLEIKGANSANAFIQFVETLGLSYDTPAALNAIIDKKLPSRRPAFSRFEAEVMGAKFEMYARPILECIKALYSDPEHVRYLCFAPERHYADVDKTIRLYHDLHTGKWWWSVQKQLESENPGATIIPIIISSDKTQVTLFRNKTAYPVYLTIGNLPKSIRQKPGRHGQILLAYLPTSRLDHITNKAARRRAVANLFHACMARLLAPLKSAGAAGIIMKSGDGVARRCHPILAAYVGDYPEQCLVTCAYTGDCPVCECPHLDLESYPTPHPYRDFAASLQAVKAIGTADWKRLCDESNMKPVQHPFWEDLPYVDIFQSTTVDVLHQLYQGVFKHLIDERVACLPPNHSIRLFYKGISNMSRVTGAEHRQISRFLLGIVVDMDVPGGREASAQLVRAMRALLDFVHMAQYPIHSSETLSALDGALRTFHDNRDIFVTLGIRAAFNIPKFHSLEHYVRCIKLFGTTDNYSTETSERLHIDFTKDAYRATNHKDEYPQMTKWLERREKVVHHANYVLWRLQQAPIGPRPLTAHHDVRWRPPDLDAELELKMTKHPTRKAVPLEEIMSPSGYGATFFVPALARFVVQWRHPEYTSRQVEYFAHDFITPFDRLPVFHRVKFWNNEIYGKTTIDSIHIHPRTSAGDQSGDIVVPARFDTALIRVRTPPPPANHDAQIPSRIWSHGRNLKDTRICQVRAVFSLPDTALDFMFPALAPHQRPPRHLAYVEWFSRFPASPERNSRMYKVFRSMENGERVASILPVSLMERSVHLIPKWSEAPSPRDWTSESVLDKCNVFYVNPFKDAHTYFNVY